MAIVPCLSFYFYFFFFLTDSPIPGVGGASLFTFFCCMMMVSPPANVTIVRVRENFTKEKIWDRDASPLALRYSQLFNSF